MLSCRVGLFVLLIEGNEELNISLLPGSIGRCHLSRLPLLCLLLCLLL